MTAAWGSGATGVLRLPSGRLVRGRGLSRPLPAGPRPDFALYLLGRRPPPVSWEARWLRWPDFWLPADRVAVREALREAWERAAAERVEIACAGGHGRTGTALACLVVIDGLPGSEAIDYVRRNYSAGAVETPWQRRFVYRFLPKCRRCPAASHPAWSHWPVAVTRGVGTGVGSGTDASACKISSVTVSSEIAVESMTR